MVISPRHFSTCSRLSARPLITTNRASGTCGFSWLCSATPEDDRNSARELVEDIPRLKLHLGSDFLQASFRANCKSPQLEQIQSPGFIAWLLPWLHFTLLSSSAEASNSEQSELSFGLDKTDLSCGLRPQTGLVKHTAGRGEFRCAPPAARA